MPPKTMSRSRTIHYRLDDEAANRQYEVRLTVELEDWERGDFTTPASGGAKVVTQLEVTLARHFDSQGNVSGVDLGAAARRFDARAWELIDDSVVSRLALSF